MREVGGTHRLERNPKGMACDDANNDEEDEKLPNLPHPLPAGIRPARQFWLPRCRTATSAPTARRLRYGMASMRSTARQQGAEECDGGNRIDYDACTSGRLSRALGDGILRTVISLT